MQKKRFLSLLLALLFICAFALTPSLGIADAGDFSGGGDYGGGSDWGGSSDWGSSDGDSFDWGSGTSGWSSDGEGIPFGGGAIAAIVVIVILVMVFKNKGSFGASQPVAPGAARTVLPMTIAQLKQMDPQFSEEALKEKIGNLYIKMQAAWQQKDWEPMRAGLSDALFNQMKSGVEAKIRSRQTNYIERIAILGVDLTGFGQDDKHDIVTAILQTRIVDYTLEDATGTLVGGSRTAEKFMTYEWTLVRTKGAKTFVSGADETKHCPNCGAPLDLNHTAKCDYCGAVIASAAYDWVLNGVKGVAQRTVGK